MVTAQWDIVVWFGRGLPIVVALMYGMDGLETWWARRHYKAQGARFEACLPERWE